MGETLYDYNEVKDELIFAIKDKLLISDGHEIKPEFMNKVGFNYEEVENLINYMKNHSKIGAVHEQISCISILYNFLDILLENDESSIKADFIFMLRCILGIKYNIKTSQLMEKYQLRNAMISLINSSIFDVDKLDYIMRDSFFTGLETPKIDTKRLFKNMFFDKNYNIVFTSNAVHTLQNTIESRDSLYMYVYNHHTVVYSDFIYTYVVERMADSARTYLLIKNPNVKKADELAKIIHNNTKKELVYDLNFVHKSYLFSIESVVENNLSDSNFISIINTVGPRISVNENEFNTTLKQPDVKKMQEQLKSRVSYTKKVIKNLRSRQFLVPWWKTVYEFTDFMQNNFSDYDIRKRLGKYICSGGDYGLSAKLFRSKLCKNVISVYNNFIKNHPKKYHKVQNLEEGDFFVAHRSTNFLGPETIEKLHIALPCAKNHNSVKKNFYIKPLTTVIPQKDYNAVYDKYGFYIYSSTEKINLELLEKVFVFVATELVSKGEQKLLEQFVPSKKPDITFLEHEQTIQNNETTLQTELYEQFCKIYYTN